MMRIIINADDFGMKLEVTDAIAEAMAKGCITQTTLMVNMPDADRAVKIARRNGFADKVGLHLNLTEGEPLTAEIKREPIFCDENGCFKGPMRPKLSAFPESTAKAVRCEIGAQIKKYIAYGLPMMHLDSHQHIHHCWQVLYVLRPLLRKYGFKTVRRTYWSSLSGDFAPHVRSRFNNFWFSINATLGGAKTADGFGPGRGFLKSFNRLKQNQIYEIMLHPRYNSKGELIDVRDFSRNEGVPCCEVRNLIDSSNGIRVGTYTDFFNHKVVESNGNRNPAIV